MNKVVLATQPHTLPVYLYSPEQVVVEAAGGLGTGNAGDPTKLTIVQAAVFAVNGTPFAGNYPTGVFTSDKWQGKDVWYYGTCKHTQAICSCLCFLGLFRQIACDCRPSARRQCIKVE